MSKKSKVCFIIMGFGVKTDYSTGETYDLDKTYKNIILPAVIDSGYQCVRADEIHDSGLIDKSMYALLMHADLVIADITTYNPNAIYELGIRHAVRPFSTIIMKAEGGVLPFDLNHTRTVHYEHLGKDIGTDEAKRCQLTLKKTIKNVTLNEIIDSPLYEFIPEVKYPELPEDELKKIIGDLVKEEKSIFAFVEKAKEHMKQGEFVEAAKLWGQASEKVPNEAYFIQQQTLATYKSKSPSEELALSDALKIINHLDPNEDTNDPETLGLTGAIYKRMWHLNKDKASLERAIQNYKKGFQIRDDYYTGENYALCLNMMARAVNDHDEKVYYKIEAKRVRQAILKILSEIEAEEPQHDNRWAYATIASCYYGLGNNESGKRFEDIFFGTTEVQWEKDTFNEGKLTLMELIKE